MTNNDAEKEGLLVKRGRYLLCYAICLLIGMGGVGYFIAGSWTSIPSPTEEEVLVLLPIFVLALVVAAWIKFFVLDPLDKRLD